MSRWELELSSALVVPETTPLTGEAVLSLARNATAAIFGSNCQSAPALFTHISFQSDAQIRAWTHLYVTGPEGGSFTIESPFWLISKEEGSVKDGLRAAAAQQSSPEDQGSGSALLLGKLHMEADSETL